MSRTKVLKVAGMVAVLAVYLTAVLIAGAIDPNPSQGGIVGPVATIGGLLAGGALFGIGVIGDER